MKVAGTCACSAESVRRSAKTSRHARTLSGIRITAMKTLTTVLLLSLAVSASAQDEAARRPAARKDGPWFGVMLPPKASASPAVKVGTRPPRPTTPTPPLRNLPAPPSRPTSKRSSASPGPPGRARKSAAARCGAASPASRRATRPSSGPSIKFRKAGITDVKTQAITQDEKSSLWLPLSWKVTLLGDPAFGAGSNDIVLESALPVVAVEHSGRHA